jgi:hypothetical protein
VGAASGDIREARQQAFKGGGVMVKSLIPAVFALALGGAVAWRVDVAVERVLTEQAARYEARIAETVDAFNAVHAAVASRDKEIAQLFDWYVELRRDLYTEWTKGIKPIKDIGGPQ